ncbi:MAG: TRAP transporter large permease [Peptococcaceae bacterium]
MEAMYLVSLGAILCISAVALIVIGLPIAYALGAAGVIVLITDNNIPLMVFPQRVFTAINSFPLLAIVFFIMAGDLMMQGGISRRLINIAKLFFGRFRGNLSLICFSSSAFFGAISGSALATSAAVGGILYPEMTKNNDYDPPFASAIVACSGTLGLMIPPSIPLILYGTLTGASVGKLFMAIIIPGFLMSIIYMGTSQFIIIRNGMALEKEKEREKVDVKKTLIDGIPAILTPVIVLGGIYSGLFTPTESAVIASIYAIIVGVFWYKELTFKTIWNALKNSAVTSAVIMFLIGTASFFGWVMTTLHIPKMVSEWFITVSPNQFVFLLMMNVLYLIAGMLMETSSIILLVVPLIYPVAAKFGVDLVHFGVITCTNLAIGMYTPPFGANVFLSAGMSSLTVDSVFKRIIPFVISGIIGILLITFIPFLSTMFI